MEQAVNILVVDDEQVVLDSIRKLLKRENYNIFTVFSAAEALEVMRSEKIDIVLTDLMMPGIDGLELMALVKKDYPRVPVIMVTGYATINTALKATQLGAFDYIAKPFSKKELIAVMKRASDLVVAADVSGEETVETGGAEAEAQPMQLDTITAIGDHSWMMMEEGGTVLLGVEGSYIQMIGKIQSIYLPSRGDELRQGGSYLQIFSSDMCSHSIPSPLTGTVVDVNRKVLDDPQSALQDPYGKGWLIRLRPSRFDAERKLLGL